jgi:flavin reductase (DIM6/NTAB) family NADH-FMN oxidoreductase RutF
VVGGDELREAMRRFAAGVCVVSFELDGEPYGLTVGSLVSLSLEPPLLGIAIGLESRVHEPLRLARRFAVNLLGGDQAALAQHFARSVPPIALWTSVRTRAGSFPAPLLEDSVAWIGCDVRDEFPAGDHTIFVSDVRSVELGQPGTALVYVHGGYREA